MQTSPPCYEYYQFVENDHELEKHVDSSSNQPEEDEEEEEEEEEEMEMEIEVSESPENDNAEEMMVVAETSNPTLAERLELEDRFLSSTTTSRMPASDAAVRRLMSDVWQLRKIDSDKLGFSAQPKNDNLFSWQVQFFNFEASSPIAQDLIKYEAQTGRNFISLEMTFPGDYPFSPPFIRVVQPRFCARTGHVTVGGSICMELLTSSGWSPTNDIESILVSIRSEMIEGDARLDPTAFSACYSLESAKEAFQRVARDHGWEGNSRSSVQ